MGVATALWFLTTKSTDNVCHDDYKTIDKIILERVACSSLLYPQNGVCHLSFTSRNLLKTGLHLSGKAFNTINTCKNCYTFSLQLYIRLQWQVI